MLTGWHRQAYPRTAKSVSRGWRNAVRALVSTDSEGAAAPAEPLLKPMPDTYLQDHAAWREVFGPLGLVLRCLRR